MIIIDKKGGKKLNIIKRWKYEWFFYNQIYKQISF